MPKIELSGGFSEDSSLQFDAQKIVNLYPEFSSTDNGKSKAKLKAVPGLTLYDEEFGFYDYVKSLGIHVMSTGRALAVYVYRIGATYYLSIGDIEFNPIGWVTAALPVGLTDNIKPIKMADNGNVLNLVITDFNVSFGYFFDTAGTILQITDPDYPDNVIGTTFKDTYFVWATKGFGSFDPSKIYISTSYATDPSNCVNALDFSTVEISPDESRAISTLGDEVVVFGSKSIQYFYNSGNVDFPFDSNKGVTQNIGTSSPFAIEKLANTLFFLGQDDTGASVAYKMSGYQIDKISTSSIEYKLNQMTFSDESDLFDINSYSYQSNGHYFYCLKIAGLNTTLCYDLTTGLWHERAYNGVRGDINLFYPVDSCAYYKGKTFIIDSSDYRATFGDVVRIAYFDENSRIFPYYDNQISLENPPLFVTRVLPHLTNENKNIQYNYLELDIQKGLGNIDTPDPVITLQISRDGGMTYGNEITMKIGIDGSYRQRVRADMLGVSRDTVFKLKSNSKVPHEWFTAYIDYEVLDE